MQRKVQKTSFKGISERGSARVSAVRPWRRDERTRPEKDVFEHSSTRGYQKIEGAIRAFNFDFRGKTVLDIGSSTGGFTEAALNHGALKVIAVEKGSHQMKAPLRFDSRIDLHEKTDIFDVSVKDDSRRGGTEPGKASKSARAPRQQDERTRPEVELSCVPDIIVADVSFISLRPILKHAKNNLSGKNTDFLMMLKPQFEAKPDQLAKGIVKNERIRRDIIKDFEAWLKNNNFVIVKKRDNTLHGKTGNIERFYWLKNSK